MVTESLRDFALLQLLWLLRSGKSRFERLLKIVYQSVKSSNATATPSYLSLASDHDLRYAD